jgi:quinolinate synthase
MKKITLEKVKNALETLEPEMIVDEQIAKQSCKPLERMLELAAK